MIYFRPNYSYQFKLFISVQIIHTSSTDAETASAESLASWNSDGFVVGNLGEVNGTSQDMVAWNWKVGTTSGIATNGSTTITPTAYSFNQTAGISIVKYTGNETAGAGLAHGLGAVPGLMIFKRLDGVTGWQVYHQSLGPTKNMVLNTTGSEETYTTRYNDTAPDSVNAILGTSTWINKSGSPHVGYIFAGKTGYSKFGSYRGNGNADGPFVYTGFRPAMIILKKTSGTGDWALFDNKRDSFNQVNKRIYPNEGGAEETTTTQGNDFLSNGFKLRGTSVNVFNSGGDDYVYAAFAEFPFVSSNSKPGMAR